MIKDILKELGFSDYETNIYLTLLDIGESTPGKVAEKANIHRRNVYDALNRLVKKGFVSVVTKNNHKHYAPVNPEKIKSTFKEKIALVEDMIKPFQQKLQKLARASASGRARTEKEGGVDGRRAAEADTGGAQEPRRSGDRTHYESEKDVGALEPDRRGCATDLGEVSSRSALYQTAHLVADRARVSEA